VSGNQALNYVRVRHEISDNGDIGRMRRQQAFLASMVNKAVSAGTLFNPPRLLSFLNAGTKSLTTDPGLSELRDLFGLAQEVRGIGLNRVQFFTVPFGAYEPDPNRLALGEDADLLWRELRSDEPLDRIFTHGAAKASEPEPSKPNPTRAAEAAQNGLCA
jgi:anionic cell wall polymer biosynthesis LytR-Cps2A-Psr (LCP) family protein